jgi:GTP cyclohydrolase I
MTQERRFLVDVGMNNLPFPIRVASKIHPDGQFTIANISINAHIMHMFEAQWIDKFIYILHQHRDIIGTKTLRTNIMDYVKEFNKAPMKIDFEYPFFIEKRTPVSKEKCLVRYLCKFSVKASVVQEPKILFTIDIPIITTYPKSSILLTERPFGQLSIISITVESKGEIYPEDIVEIVDKHALAPVYSYLTPEDQDYVIRAIHQGDKSSVVTVDEIKDELAHDRNIEWYSVRSSNFGMLHSYSTVIATEKSSWVPFSGFSEELDRDGGLL